MGALTSWSGYFLSSAPPDAHLSNSRLAHDFHEHGFDFLELLLRLTLRLRMTVIDCLELLLCLGFDRLELLLRLGMTLVEGLALGITLASLSAYPFVLVRPEIGIPDLRVLYDLQVCVVIPRHVLAGSNFAICGFGLVQHPAEKLPPQEDANGSDGVNAVMALQQTLSSTHPHIRTFSTLRNITKNSTKVSHYESGVTLSTGLEQ